MTDNNIFRDDKKVKSISYENFLKAVQEYISNKFSDLLSKEPTKEELLSYVTQFYNENNYVISEQRDFETIKHWAYNDMARFSILTDFVDGSRKDIEEVNINSWEDIVIIYADGRIEKSKRKFMSPQHAIDVTKKLLHESKMVLDASKPKVVGFLGKNVRITATMSPVVDDDAGIALSIRIINPRKLSRDDFIANNTATPGMLDLLCLALQYHVSVCVAGATSSGKTTLLDYILKAQPDLKRIITIEEKVREFDLVRRDENGNILNNVVQMKTIEKENEKECITAEDLLVTALTMHPDIISIAEMKSSEAFATQEAARTGHAVITTIHADSAEDTFDRMTTLCMIKHEMDYKIVNNLVKKAFQIVAFEKQLEDKSRHIMKIIECFFDDNGDSHINILYKFVTEKNVYNKDGKCTKVIGHYEKVNDMSSKLRERFIDNGIPAETLAKLEGKI